MHLPRLPVSPHDWQVPEQAMSQQMPAVLSHTFDPHSLPWTQGVPRGFLPQLPVVGIDALGVQTLPVVQSALTLAGSQVPRQVLVVPHWKGSQGSGVPFPHFPIPSQTPASVSTDPEQVWALQIVPAPSNSQLPAPSQLPSLPQVVELAGGHWPAGAGRCAGSGKQCPGELAWLHATQVPVQTLSQQTPCWQDPVEHSLLTVHVAPITFLPQVPPLQTLPGEQSALVLQVTRQVPAVPHMYSLHDTEAAAVQVPRPSQCAAALPTEPPTAQVGSWQVVAFE